MYWHERKELGPKEYKGPPPNMPPRSSHSDLAVKYLQSRGLDPEVAGVNGWYPTVTDVPRLVIPCVNSTGRVYYQARALDSTTALRYDSPFEPRGDSIIVVHPMGFKKQRAVIVEGPMDALAAAEYGYLGIAVMGNNPAQEAIDLIVKKFAITHAPFWIVPDMDDPTFGAKMLASFASRRVAAKVALLTGGKDICELSGMARKKFFDKLGKGK